MGCFDTEDGEEKCARLVQLFMGRLKTLFLEKSAVLKSCILKKCGFKPSYQMSHSKYSFWF